MSSEPDIQVEFYGIARQRVGQLSVSIEAPPDGTRLSALWNELSTQFPQLSPPGTPDGIGTLYLVNVNGDRFITDPETKIHAGQSVLIMSPDAGG